MKSTQHQQKLKQRTKKTQQDNILNTLPKKKRKAEKSLTILNLD